MISQDKEKIYSENALMSIKLINSHNCSKIAVNLVCYEVFIWWRKIKCFCKSISSYNNHFGLWENYKDYILEAR
ncbi:unnamed protein product [Blepharisma stoltei]|uniref:Uncharacterized protein n=1 Tax=Blepharisma stoltei TaxID=1481888 RepID=A0AAU9KAS1_9CILI|nr:unnamed protein product [Blepharisma stoltei]